LEFALCPRDFFAQFANAPLPGSESSSQHLELLPFLPKLSVNPFQRDLDGGLRRSGFFGFLPFLLNLPLELLELLLFLTQGSLLIGLKTSGEQAQRKGSDYYCGADMFHVLATP
jgi:hypothetical protein